jgi:hypothetical protein
MQTSSEFAGFIAVYAASPVQIPIKLTISRFLTVAPLRNDHSTGEI